MASHARRPLSFFEKLSALATVAISLTKTIFNAITKSSIYRQHQWPVKRIFATKFLQQICDKAGTGVFKLLQPTTGQSLRSMCRKANLQLTPHNLHVGGEWPDATLHEISITPDATSNKSGRRAMVFFHGGGYRNPISKKGHIPFAISMAKTMNASKLFVLEYALTPERTYPTQLAQGVATLRVLLSEFGYGLGDLVLVGDSAGGNLALGLLAHLVRPHPQLEKITGISEGEKFKGVMLVSPWASMEVSSVSYKDNETKDMLTGEGMEGVIRDLKAPKRDIYVDMVNAKDELWEKVPAEKILVTAGGLELFRDDILIIAQRLEGARKNGAKVELFLAEGEVHDQVVLDNALGIEGAKSTRAMYQWCLEL